LKIIDKNFDIKNKILKKEFERIMKKKQFKNNKKYLKISNVK